MLMLVPDNVRRLSDRWMGVVADRRALSAIDPAADAFAKAAKELADEITRAEDATRHVSVVEFAQLRGVRPGTIRKWCARGLLAGAVKNAAGDWEIPVGATRARTVRRARARLEMADSE
jgi:hypothetical protein